MIIDQIPGYQEAVRAAQEEESALRELAFLPVEISIAGSPAVQLTLRRLLLLRAAKSVFVFGGRAVEPRDICLTLWILSPQFEPLNTSARDLFFAHVLGLLEVVDFTTEIDVYLADALLDLPKSRPNQIAESYASLAASFVHSLAAAYGIRGSLREFRDEILDMPLAELAQYQRLILLDKYPEARLVNELSARTARRMVASALETERQAAAAASEAAASASPEPPTADAAPDPERERIGHIGPIRPIAAFPKPAPKRRKPRSSK